MYNTLKDTKVSVTYVRNHLFSTSISSFSKVILCTHWPQSYTSNHGISFFRLVLSTSFYCKLFQKPTLYIFHSVRNEITWICAHFSPVCITRHLLSTSFTLFSLYLKNHHSYSKYSKSRHRHNRRVYIGKFVFWVSARIHS